MLGEEMVEQDQADRVMLACRAGEDGERPDPGIGRQVWADRLERALEGLAGEVLVGHAPLPRFPALADEAHRVGDENVIDLHPRSIVERLPDRPGGKVVIAVDEQARQEFGAIGRRESGRGSGRIDRGYGRGSVVVHLPDSTIAVRVSSRSGYDGRVYIDALEFLDEEHDAFQPFEALAELTDEQLGVQVAGAHGWSGRQLMGHLLSGQEVALAVATELAVNETSPARERAETDWDTRGGEVVNAEIDARWAALPMDELRATFGSMPGQLRGYLTVVPESRWLKHADHQRFFLSETTTHYEDHLDDLAAILAAAGR